MTKNLKATSGGIATLASSTLSNPNASTVAKSFAASALSQSSTSKQTSSKMETKASAVLKSAKYSSQTKSLAASVLAQSNKHR